ncbi:MAG: nucleoside-diphosphate sugar epimerase/dehydratase [Eubacteriales bacterium]|nr:nucleoside-diphosphate sugar epimerase/dehydratase [Eubacteriales bacterium]
MLPGGKRKAALLLQRLGWAGLDIVCVLGSMLCALFLCHISFEVFWPAALWYAGVSMLVFTLSGLYYNLWRFAGIRELLQTALGVLVAWLFCLPACLPAMLNFPLRACFTCLPLMLLTIGGTRLLPRAARFMRRQEATSAVDRRRTLVVGAGEAGEQAIAEMQTHAQTGLVPCIVVDDAAQKQHCRVHGVPVEGTTADIPRLVKKLAIEEIIFAIPSADAADRRRILEICAGTKRHTRTLPTMDVMMRGVRLERLREINPSDLLERPQVLLDVASVRRYVQGRTVLVTGGGGSIGSELCRQLALFSPAKLVIFDIYENNAYELFMDLTRIYGDSVPVEVVIGSVRDEARLREVFAQYRPAVVFHAAAHKHVPLMEVSPAEAIKNNVFGTWNTARVADAFGVERFVLISTDKAVNPANVMGASKYLAELVISYMNQTSQHTSYAAVRFGNVLGSAGSVIPLFRQQIAAGGPVTVTHKDVTRYFMTIPEAARLVLQAGSMAKEGQVFVLDMGEPVRIDDFARKFIRLSGYEPGVDMDIVYTGLRPGEKMYEELMQTGEQVANTSFPGILVGHVADLAPQDILAKLEYLRRVVQETPDKAREAIAQVVPTYTGLEDSDQS